MLTDIVYVQVEILVGVKSSDLNLKSRISF